MPINKRGKSWQVNVTVNGRRIRKTFSDWEAARVFELECRADLLSGREPLKTPKPRSGGIPRTFGAMTEHIWKLEWSKQKAADSTYNRVQSVCSYFGDHTDIQAITPYDLEQFVLHLTQTGNGPATVNRKLAVVSKVMKYAYRHGLIDKKPDMPLQREPRGRIKYYSHEEEEEMLAAMDDPDLRDFFIVLVDTGMRRGEVLNLEWEDVDFDKKTVVLGDPEAVKTSITRLVPATARVLSVLNQRLLDGESRPFDFTGPQMDYAAACFKNAANSDEKFSAIFHTCRHTFISRLVQNGVPIVAVKELAGHRDIRTTMRYSHLAPSNLFDAISTLEKSACPNTIKND